MKRFETFLVTALVLLVAAPALAQRGRGGRGNAKEFWDQRKAKLDQETAGWDQETIDYDAWIQDGKVGLEKTRKRLVSYDLQTAIGRYGRKMTRAELDAVRKDIADWERPAADRLCAEITRVMKQAEEDGDVNRNVLSNRLRAFSDDLRKARSSGQHQAVVDAIKALREKLKEAGKKLVAGMRTAAKESWAEWMEELKADCEELDPVQCVKDIDSWKDKKVRLQNPHQLAGKEYAWSDFHLITSINGAPVAVAWDEELRTKVQAVEKATAVTYDIGKEPMEDMIGVVSGIAQVQRIEYDNRRRQWINVGAPVEAPLLKMVAVKAGPFAVAVDKGSMLEKVEGVEERSGDSSSDSSSSSSSSSKTKKDEGSSLGLICGVLFVLLLGIGGGVGGVLFWQKKQSELAAAGGAPAAAASATPPAEAPPAAPPADASAPPPAEPPSEPPSA